MKSKAHTFNINRRRFLQNTTALAAASTLPKWFLEEQTFAAAKPPGPNDKPALALVGCGGMGRADARNASRLGQIVALCDVDETNLAQAKKEYPQAETYKDFRKVMARDDIHAVICGTVDHWHTLVSMAALKSGKHVYCEKPLTLTIDEGKRLVKAVKDSGRVLQTGSQQRSDKNFRLACELVRNGRIGRLTEIHTWLPAGRREGPFAPSEPPAGFDWNTWLGQTAVTPYVKERSHGTFRYWWDYSGGTMTDWGAHHNDIALWGSGYERSGPVRVIGRPLVDMIPGGFTASSEYEVEFTYANGVRHLCRSTTADTWSGGVADKSGQRHGVRFVGTIGWIWVTRGAITASSPDMLNDPLPSTALRLYESNDHMGNFFDCMKTGRQPICDAEIGHRSATVCHLGAIAMRLARQLTWDPKAEKFVGDREADSFIEREMRKGFGYDYIA